VQADLPAAVADSNQRRSSILASDKLWATMAKAKPVRKDVLAVSFFGFATHYQKAANLLYEADSKLSGRFTFSIPTQLSLRLRHSCRRTPCSMQIRILS
jgi:hypothetical protein